MNDPTTTPAATAASIELLGGAVCLDFVNTVARRRGAPHEHLASYADFVEWAQHAGAVSSPATGALLERATRRPAAARAALDQVLSLREAIYRVFYMIAL